MEARSEDVKRFFESLPMAELRKLDQRLRKASLENLGPEVKYHAASLAACCDDQIMNRPIGAEPEGEIDVSGLHTVQLCVLHAVTVNHEDEYLQRIFQCVFKELVARNIEMRKLV